MKKQILYEQLSKNVKQLDKNLLRLHYALSTLTLLVRWLDRSGSSAGCLLDAAIYDSEVWHS